MKNANPSPKRLVRRKLRHWVDELRLLGYGRIMWMIQSNLPFFLKIVLFLLVVGALAGAEYLLISRGWLHHHPPPVSRHQAETLGPMLRSAIDLVQQQKPNAALEKVNFVLQAAPENPIAYELRADIYAQKKQFDLAQKDYEKSLEFNDKNVQVKFNLAEILFLKKEYDVARPGFEALEGDSNIGDLAKYKVFLCDLFGGRSSAAESELAAFNQVGSNPSYYFANAAWSLYHINTDDGQAWVRSAASIYAPAKFKLYAASLVDLGYVTLPLPPPTHTL